VRYSAVIIVLAVAVALIGGFFHPFGEPRVEPAKGLDTLLLQANMPADAKKVLINHCADCHSNETRWPVYARLAPGSWLIERDIVEARKKMNLSIWDRMPADMQEELIGQIIHEAKGNEMPPLQYRLLHPSSALTTQEVVTLSSMEKGAAEPQSGATETGDAARGKMVFEKRCTGCHALEGNREGPPLGGVFGRRAGSLAGFDYSIALKSSNVTWSEATLDKWLSDPDTMVADNKMDFRLPKAQERADIIAYFKQQK
jgi:cytochrome c